MVEEGRTEEETVLIDLTKDDEEEGEKKKEKEESKCEPILLEDMIRDVTCAICSKIVNHATAITVCCHRCEPSILRDYMILLCWVLH